MGPIPFLPLPTELRCIKLKSQSHLSDSNWRPTHYKWVALPTELRWRIWFFLSFELIPSLYHATHLRQVVRKSLDSFSPLPTELRWLFFWSLSKALLLCLFVGKLQTGYYPLYFWLMALSFNFFFCCSVNLVSSLWSTNTSRWVRLDCLRSCLILRALSRLRCVMFSTI